MRGEKTVEGYISGEGEFIIERIGGKKDVFKVKDGDSFQIDVKVGEIMQWRNTKNSDLIFFEICLPPYSDGRYKNLNDE